MSSSECPGDTLWCQIFLNMAIFGDILIVIKVYKTIILYLPVNSKDSHNEKQAHQYITAIDDKFFATIICSGHGTIAGNEDSFLWIEIVIQLNILLIKVITDWLCPKTVSAYRKHAFTFYQKP